MSVSAATSPAYTTASGGSRPSASVQPQPPVRGPRRPADPASAHFVAQRQDGDHHEQGQARSTPAARRNDHHSRRHPGEMLGDPTPAIDPSAGRRDQLARAGAVGLHPSGAHAATPVATRLSGPSPQARRMSLTCAAVSGTRNTPSTSAASTISWIFNARKRRFHASDGISDDLGRDREREHRHAGRADEHCVRLADAIGVPKRRRRRRPARAATAQRRAQSVPAKAFSAPGDAPCCFIRSRRKT